MPRDDNLAAAFNLQWKHHRLIPVAARSGGSGM